METVSSRELNQDISAAKRAVTRRPVADAVIAATALVHDLILVTRDIDDFLGSPG